MAIIRTGFFLSDNAIPNHKHLDIFYDFKW